MSPRLTILALSDLHAAESPQGRGKRGDLAAVLVRKALLRLAHGGIKPDLIVLLGDTAHESPQNDGTLLSAVYAEAAKAGVPCLSVRGNHDGPGHYDSGLHAFGGYNFFVFSDDYAKSGKVSRSREQLAALGAAGKKTPLIALQHCPVFPDIASAYPYLPKNAADVRTAYENAGVVLSLSGHYHKGQRCAKHNGVTYHTVRALYETPFCFSVVELTGRRVKITEHELKNPVAGIADSHSHTQFAYCATTVTAEKSIDLARELGVARQYLTEHTFQLYFDKPEGMSFAWKHDPAIPERVWRTPGRCRMEAYRAWARRLRSDFVRIGLEADMLDDGRLLLAPEDADGWDVIVGALHEVTGRDSSKTQRQAETLFLKDMERIVQTPINILAHPFRFFRRKKYDHPVHLYKPVVKILAGTGIAAEINFHTYNPDPEFVRLCLEHGVKISLGSDAHDLAECGEFWPHLRVLEQAGLRPRDFAQHIFH